MESLKIILLAIVAGIVYGVVHDQVTARVCLEYFSVVHPRIIDSQSPTALAFAWGVVATWWAGAFLGVLLAVAARGGSRKPIPAAELIRPIVQLLLVMACFAIVAGGVGYFLAKKTFLSPPVWMVAVLPASRYPAFMADLWAHSASYASAFLGGLALCAAIYRGRGVVGTKAS
jgi:hypothetical protein